MNLKKIDAGILKIIALITMLIDHSAAVVVSQFGHYGEDIQTIYTVMRNIGRIAFPIFCFLLVEGFFHTKNLKKYFLRLFLFALISEVPFDLALLNTPFNMNHQNVFWTLFLGLAAVAVVEKIKSLKKLHPVIIGILGLLAIIVIMIVAEVLSTDYGANGVALIIIFYAFRQTPIIACVVGYILFLFEPYCLPAFLLIPFYNGKRGWQLKYLYYIFYPAHLLILYLLRVLLLK